MKKAELLFIPAPGAGHLVSALQFGKRLLQRDDRISITVLAIKSAAPSSLGSYTEALVASESRLQLIDVPQAELPPLEFAKSPAKFFILNIENHVPNVREALTNYVSSKQDSVPIVGVVLDFFCVSMIDVVNEFNLPSYLFMTSNAGYLSFEFHFPAQDSRTGRPPKDSDPDWLVPGIVPPVPTKVLPVSLTDDQTTPPVYPVGPVLDLNDGQARSNLNQAQRDKIISWLDDQPEESVVFLCFGSMGSFTEAQVKEIALGLEQSGQRFLWSLRLTPPKGSKSLTPVDCSNLEEVLPDGFLERTREKELICGWAPQVDVLSHKATGGFVSHCGWNSILESLWHGVPIVTWPMYAEQQLNAFRLVKEMGLGLEMRLDYKRGGDEVVKADEIGKAVASVMENSEVRKKVKEIGVVCRKAVEDGGSSSVSLGRFIEDVMRNHFGSD
ncbi:hypothetical protein ACLB2K_030099 [Fragaria x ananassa]